MRIKWLSDVAFLNFSMIYVITPHSAIYYNVIILCVRILIPYSRKYWQALNLAVEPKIAIPRILADLNLAVRYGIAIRIYIYASRKFWRIFKNLAVAI